MVDKLFEDVASFHAQPHGKWAEIVGDADVAERGVIQVGHFPVNADPERRA